MSSILSPQLLPSFILPDGGVRPPLKWAGGKRWLVSVLRKKWLKHSHRRLVEPFCGGLAVVLGLLPEKAILNDINPHVINFYKHLKKGLVIRSKQEYDSEFYYECREEFNSLIREGKAESRRGAELFYYLNRTGYNGLCRFNQQGEYNVPFGTHANIRYRKSFLHYKETFRNWEFSCGDFENTQLSSNDLIYADPPYDVQFTKYSKEGFSWDDQKRLANWLSQHKGPVILSNQATDRITNLYEEFGFKLEYHDAPRHISCTGNREKAREVVATLRI